MPCSGCSALHGVNPNLKKQQQTITIATGLQQKDYDGQLIIL